MADYWFDDDENGSADDEPSQDGAPDADDGAVEEPDKKALLRSLIETGGLIGGMAADALDALETREREANEHASALADAEAVEPEALATLVAKYEAARFDDSADPQEVAELGSRVEAVKNALRARVIADRRVTDDRIVTESERLMRDKAGLQSGQPLSDEMQSEMTNLRAEIAQAQAQDGDPLNDSAVWQEFEWSRVQEQRAVEVANDEQINRPGAWERMVDDAQADYDSMVDELAGA